MPTPEQVPTWFSELLARELGSVAPLSEPQIGQLFQHYGLLLRWNEKMNLTTVKPGPEMVIRHYCESLFFAAHVPTQENISLMDLGSGAGFPGVPMAILKPNWRVTLVESSQRKAVFLRESSRDIRNITVLAERIEVATSHVDWVVARAVDPVEIIRQVPRLAQNVGIMLGKEDFLSIRDVSRIAWAAPVRLPWGDRKLCVFGRST